MPERRAMTSRASSSTRRHARATSKRKSLLDGPMRDVVYILAREGKRGGGYWWLVLDCGHAVARPRYTTKHWTAMVHLMFKPLAEKLAPKRCQCHYCGSGTEKIDPWITIKAFGGPSL